MKPGTALKGATILLVVLAMKAYANPSVGYRTKHTFSDTEFLQEFGYPVDYHAYLDTSYNYLTQHNQFTSRTYDRLFDIEENGFTLNQFGFYVQKMPEKGWGGRLRVITGSDANYAAPSGWNPYFGSQTLAMYPYEAFLQYSFSKLSIMGGVLDTLIGLESNESAEDLNFSRSILSYAQPGTYVGLRTTYEWSDLVKLYVGLGNGWSTIRNAGQQTMVDVAGSYAPSEKFSISLHGSNGPQYIVRGAHSGLQSRFSIIDLVGSYDLTKKIFVELNADYYSQEKGQLPNGQNTTVSWSGVAGYLSYRFNDQWRVSGRAEVFNDGDGFSFGVRQTWSEATLTLQFMPRTGIILRAETRHDFSNVNSIIKSNGVGSTNNQQSFAMEGIYIFK